MAELLDRGSKLALISELGILTDRFGQPPLTNVTSPLEPDDIDVIAVGSVLVDSAGGVVLVRRAETPNEWIIPGGTVDPGESLLQAAVREVQEETGLVSEVVGLVRIGLATNYGPPEFRSVNVQRYGKERIGLLFVNFLARPIGGQVNGGDDPANNILEAKQFLSVPFDQITNVYKVLFVHLGLADGDISRYQAVDFGDEAPD